VGSMSAGNAWSVPKQGLGTLTRGPEHQSNGWHRWLIQNSNSNKFK
jgi:hypothetical protein